MEIQRHVDVQVAANSTQVTRQGFGVPLIPSFHTRWSDRFRGYASAAAMLTDGFLATDIEYKIASRIFQQDQTVQKVIVGRRLTATIQRWTVTPTVANGAVYQLLVGGLVGGVYTEATVSYTSDGTATAAEINAGLKAAIDALGLGLTTTAAATLTIVSNTAGAWFRLKNVTPNLLSVVMDATDAGITTDLNDLFALTKEFYTVHLTFPSAAEVAAACTWGLTNKRPVMFTTQDTPCIAGTTGNIGRTLKDTNNKYAWGAFSHDNGNFLDAGWAGVQLPQDPGSETWKFAKINGATADALTDQQVDNLDANRLNWYCTANGRDMMGEGVTSDPDDFIDTVRGLDWYQARARERIFTTIAGASPGKIPYTDKGIGMIEKDLIAQNQEAVDVGLFTGEPPLAPVVSVPTAASASTADRSGRILRNLTVVAYLAGAVHKTQVRVNVLA